MMWIIHIRKTSHSIGCVATMWVDAPCFGVVSPIASANWISRRMPRTALGWTGSIRYKDIAPWYDYVESFAGISGSNEGSRSFQTESSLPPMEMTQVETHVRQGIESSFDNRTMIIGRVANPTQPHNGRGSNCQFRNRCIRGCPYGAYFSSNASTLPADSLPATSLCSYHPLSSIRLSSTKKGHRCTYYRCGDCMRSSSITL